MPEAQTLSELLGGLAGHGVYDVAFLHEQLSKFGFTYEQDGTLRFANGVTDLPTYTPDEMTRIMGEDPKGGILDVRDENTRLFDALDLSIAVHKLLLPGKVVPSSLYHGRGKGFRQNIAAIERWEQLKDDMEVN